MVGTKCSERLDLKVSIAPESDRTNSKANISHLAGEFSSLPGGEEDDIERSMLTKMSPKCQGMLACW